MKKLLLTIIALFSFTLFSQSVSADTSATTITFSQLKLTVDDYADKDISVSYRLEGVNEIADIIDNQTGQLLESVIFKPDLTRSVYNSLNLTRQLVVGRTIVQITIPVNVYQNGSFRQINGVGTASLNIISAITKTTIENGQASAWSTNYRYPTTSLQYSFSGTLLATLHTGTNGSVNAGIKGELFNAGFSVGDSSGTTTYFRRYFEQSGTISL